MVQKQTEAIQHILPRRDTPSATAAPGTRPPSARHRGRPPVSSRAAPPHVESTPRPPCRASRRIAVLPASQPGPRLSRKSTKRPWRGQPRDVGVCSFSGDGKNSVAPSPEEGRVENPKFHFISVPQKPTLSKKEQFPFPLGFQVRGPTVYNPLPPHFHPWPILPAVRGRSASPHISSQSPLGLRELCEDGDHPALLPFPAPPQVRRLYRWSHLHGVWKRGLRCSACLVGSRAQFDSAAQFSSPGDLSSSAAFLRLRWQPRMLLSCTRRLLSSWPVPPAEMRQGFYSPYFIVPKKGGGLRPILDLRVLNRALHRLPFKMLMHRHMIKCIQPQDWFAAINLKDAYFHVFLYEIQLLLFFFQCGTLFSRHFSLYNFLSFWALSTLDDG